MPAVVVLYYSFMQFLKRKFKMILCCQQIVCIRPWNLTSDTVMSCRHIDLLFGLYQSVLRQICLKFLSWVVCFLTGRWLQCSSCCSHRNRRNWGKSCDWTFYRVPL